MDYLIPGFLGFFVGAALFGLTYDKVFLKIEKLAKVGNVVMPDLWKLSPFLFILLFVLIALFLFYLIDRFKLERKNKVVE